MDVITPRPSSAECVITAEMDVHRRPFRDALCLMKLATVLHAVARRMNFDAETR